MPLNLTRRAFLARLAKVAGVVAAAPALVKVAEHAGDALGTYFYKVTPQFGTYAALDRSEFPWWRSGKDVTIIADRVTAQAYRDLLESGDEWARRLNAKLFVDDSMKIPSVTHYLRGQETYV